jgi:hypothetical protein
MCACVKKEEPEVYLKFDPEIRKSRLLRVFRPYDGVWNSHVSFQWLLADIELDFPDSEKLCSVVPLASSQNSVL